METPPTYQTYDPVARLLHWSIAALWMGVFIMGILAVYGRDTLNPHHELTIAHKAIASAMLALIALRVVWRLTHRPPPLAETMSPLMQRAAHAGHVIIYAIALIALPMSGWMWSSVADKPIMVLWVFKLPPLVDPAQEYYDLAKWVHISIAWSAGALVVGHLMMALKHHLIDRDHTLRTMLPGKDGK